MIYLRNQAKKNGQENRVYPKAYAPARHNRHCLRLFLCLRAQIPSPSLHWKPFNVVFPLPAPFLATEGCNNTLPRTVTEPDINSRASNRKKEHETNPKACAPAQRNRHRTYSKTNAKIQTLLTTPNRTKQAMKPQTGYVPLRARLHHPTTSLPNTNGLIST